MMNDGPDDKVSPSGTFRINSGNEAAIGSEAKKN